MTEKRIVLVGIGGASSSGKTTVAKILNSITKDSIILHKDDFFKSDEEIPIDKETGFENWDCPEAINFDAFVEEVEYLKKNGVFSINSKTRFKSDTGGAVDIIESDLIDSLTAKLNKLIDENNLHIVYVDGFLLHHDPNIIKLFDINLLLLASYKTLKERRAARNGYLTQESYWVDPPGFFDGIVYPSYKKAYSYLFINHDVEDKINPGKINDLEINVLYNNEGTSITQIFQSCFEQVLEDLLKL